MSLLTRCPRCRTLYRVTPAQLQTRDGKVRCGRCMNVFDGFQALAVEQGDAASEPVRFEAAASADERPAPPSPPPEIFHDTAPKAEHAPPPVTDAPAADARPATRPSTVLEPHEPAEPHEAARAEPQEPAEPQLLDPAPPAPSHRTRPRSPKTWALAKPGAATGWVAACALALIVLALQLVYAARGELAARNPTLKAVFSSVCARVGCTLSFPHHPELVKIEASDVRMVDASRRELVQLTATLRSYAGYYLAYPALDLVLTNANEHALARRVFVPQEYLGPNRDPNAGFAPHAEITIALDLDTGNENAAGFRLDLLAAP